MRSILVRTFSIAPDRAVHKIRMKPVGRLVFIFLVYLQEQSGDHKILPFIQGAELRKSAMALPGGTS